MTKRYLLVLVALFFTAIRVEAGETMHKEFQVGATPCVTIEAGAACVKVEIGDDSRIEADVHLPGSGLYVLEATQEGNHVKLVLKPKGTLGWLLQPVTAITDEEARITVKVPASCDIVLDTWSGRMEVRGIEGEIRARTGSEVFRLIRTFFKATAVASDTI